MTDVCALSDLADQSATKFEVERADGTTVDVSVVRIGDNVYAIADVCTHANVSLSDGDVWCDELELECPKHGSAFNLLSGEPSTLPATQPIEVFDATVVDGRVHVTARTTNSGGAS
jgi:3-phenylpropionate/trans-cinnamate dioxygenase ferredoxin subunit